jgi:diaminopimelate epimerase
VSIGNPQCAIHVATLEELESLDLPAIGPAIESDAQFPNRTNVSWYTAMADANGSTRIRARIFERGVGETLSSGTGATGAAVAYAQEHGSAVRPTRITVVLDGGELEVEVGADLRVNLTGWARPVFEGRLSEEFEKELHETE